MSTNSWEYTPPTIHLSRADKEATFQEAFELSPQLEAEIKLANGVNKVAEGVIICFFFVVLLAAFTFRVNKN